MKRNIREGLLAFGVIFPIASFAFVKTELNMKTALISSFMLALVIGFVISMQEKRIMRKNSAIKDNFNLAKDSVLVATKVSLKEQEGILIEGTVIEYGHSIRAWNGMRSRAVLYAKKIKENVYEVNNLKLLYIADDYKLRNEIFKDIRFLETTTRKITREGILGEINDDYDTPKWIFEYWTGV